MNLNAQKPVLDQREQMIQQFIDYCAANKVYRKQEMAHTRIDSDAMYLRDDMVINKGSKLEWANTDLERANQTLGKSNSKVFRTDHLDFRMED